MELREHFKMHPGETFVDVGSNVGFYSLLLGKRDSDITIISIEAHPDTFEALNKNIKINSFKNIISINKAISSHNKGKLRLYEYWTEKDKKMLECLIFQIGIMRNLLKKLTVIV